MIGCLRTRGHKQPIIVLYSEFVTVLKFYNLEAGARVFHLVSIGFWLEPKQRHYGVVLEQGTVLFLSCLVQVKPRHD